MIQFIVIFLIVLLLYFSYFFLVFTFTPYFFDIIKYLNLIDFSRTSYWDKLGQFGDTFGAINAFFSGLAFAAIFYTILIQWKELIQTKEQINNQQFENIFFNLLGRYNEILNEVDISSIYKEFFDKWNSTFKTGNCDEAKHQQMIKGMNKELYEKKSYEIEYYFRNLYNLIDIVKNSKIHDDDKKIYINIISSQLSNYELLMLFYNGLSEFGDRKFKPLIEEFALLKYLPKEKVLHSTHLNFYEDSAYGED